MVVSVLSFNNRFVRNNKNGNTVLAFFFRGYTPLEYRNPVFEKYREETDSVVLAPNSYCNKNISNTTVSVFSIATASVRNTKRNFFSLDNNSILNISSIISHGQERYYRAVSSLAASTTIFI